jgi:hypothetical protein
VPVIKSGDLGQPEALGDGSHGGIDDTKRKIASHSSTSAAEFRGEDLFRTFGQVRTGLK